MLSQHINKNPLIKIFNVEASKICKKIFLPRRESIPMLSCSIIQRVMPLHQGWI